MVEMACLVREVEIRAKEHKLLCGGTRNRTLINGFGDRYSTIKLHPH